MNDLFSPSDSGWHLDFGKIGTYENSRFIFSVAWNHRPQNYPSPSFYKNTGTLGMVGKYE